MTSPVLVFCLTCLLLEKMAQTSVRQESSFVSVTAGDELTLRCSYEGDVAGRLYWYKYTLGHKPRAISTFYTFDKNGTFYGEFNNNPRFTLDNKHSKNHLTITDVHVSDSATYFCMSSYLYTLDISESITVIVKGSGVSVPASVHQSASETLQPGGSVTLNCTVHTGTCDGEHSVYWFRQEGQSHPGLIYTQGGRRDQCERTPGAQTHTCVYNLPMESLNLSHAGTYYCAVASCGHILFGNETKLDFRNDDLVYFWSGASALTAVLLVLLALSVCTMSKRDVCRSTESKARFSAPSNANAKGYQKAHNLYYAALSVDLASRSRRRRDQTWSECVYYRVKQ